MRDLPCNRLLMEVQAPKLERLRFVSQSSIQPLRVLVLVVPLAEQVVVERNLQPPQDPWWRAHLQELRVLELPPERI
jgi:hypothetical protein